VPAYRVFLLISGVTAFAGACAFTLNLVYQVQTVGLGPLELVLAGTALEVTCLVAQLPTGIIADLYSRRLSVIVGVLLTGAGTLLEGLVPAFLAILGGSVLWGIGATCLDGALEAWAADEIGEDRVGHVLTRGAQVGQAATVLGLGTPVGFIGQRLSIRAALVASGLLLAPAVGFLAAALAHTSSPVKFPRKLRNLTGERDLDGPAAPGEMVVAGEMVVPGEAAATQTNRLAEHRTDAG
jgi:DHA3 family tetracycline resistance protein-like MFS transporter